MIETAPAATAPSTVTPVAADTNEGKLIDEVGTLWKVHTEAQTAFTKSREETKLVRRDLSRRLYELKSVLSKPGRGGAWSSFLEAQKIPRSSADRLARAHEKTLVPQANCTAEQIPASTEVIVHKYFHALWPRLSKVLTTQESVELFICELRSRTDKLFSAAPPATSGS